MQSLKLIMVFDESKRLDIDIEMGFAKTSSNESPLSNWIADIEARVTDKNSSSQEELPWNTTTIYKVPGHWKELNHKEFTPIMLSFGPYHHDEKELQLMNVHKERAFLQFIRRANRPLKTIMHDVSKIMPSLRDAYSYLDDKWKIDDEVFIKMMTIDGCFMLEVLLIAFGMKDDRYLNTDPYFSRKGLERIKPFIRRDMLLLENQLPLFLLRALMSFQDISFQDKNEEDEPCIDAKVKILILNFVMESNFGGWEKFWKLPSLHALDLFRRSLFGPEPKAEPSHKSRLTSQVLRSHCRCAVELSVAGVRFMKTKSRSLKDIHFNPKNGILYLPFFKVDTVTESTLLNMIMLEHLHFNSGKYLTSYITFMDELVSSAEDVRLLRENGIIFHLLGSDEKAADMFNNITKNMTLTSYNYGDGVDQVRRQINNYCGKRRNTWKANFIHIYFASPWTVIKLFGALLAVGFAIIQTIYAIKGGK